MATFIPDRLEMHFQEVPFFEDSQKLDIPGRGTHKSLGKLQNEIIDTLARLGAGAVQFIPGTYEGAHPRYGYQISFMLGGVQGRMDCAALPLRAETLRRKEQALAQALYLVRDELRALVHSAVYKPGSVPLVPYLLGAEGKTVTEWLVETQNVPQLTARSAQE